MTRRRKPFGVSRGRGTGCRSIRRPGAPAGTPAGSTSRARSRRPPRTEPSKQQRHRHHVQQEERRRRGGAERHRRHLARRQQCHDRRPVGSGRGGQRTGQDPDDGIRAPGRRLDSPAGQERDDGRRDGTGDHQLQGRVVDVRVEQRRRCPARWATRQHTGQHPPLDHRTVRSTPSTRCRPGPSAPRPAPRRGRPAPGSAGESPSARSRSRRRTGRGAASRMTSPVAIITSGPATARTYSRPSSSLRFLERRSCHGMGTGPAGRRRRKRIPATRWRSRRALGAAERAELEGVRKLAEEDVTVFGEQLRRLDTEVGGHELDEAIRVDYQAALDAYESAQRAAPRIRSVDQISAVVDTLSTRPFRPRCVQARAAGQPLPERRTPCFFNPQHGPAATDVMWTRPGHGTRQGPGLCPGRGPRGRARAARDPPGDGPGPLGPVLGGGRGVPALHRGLLRQRGRHGVGPQPGHRRPAGRTRSATAAGAVATTAVASTAAASTAAATAAAAAADELVAQRTQCGPVAAHAVHAGPGRRWRPSTGTRRGPRCVRTAPGAGPAGAGRGRAGGDVAADVVRVVRREPGRVGDVLADDPLAQPGREPLDLVEHQLGGVAGVRRAGRARRPRPGARRPRSGSGRRGTAGRPARTGRSGSTPRSTCRSAAAISSRVPPTCTVPARRQASAVHGTPPRTARSTLCAAKPYRHRGRRRSAPAMAANAVGVVSKSVDAGRRAGRRASARGRRSRISPPSDRSRLASASVIAREPPSATGQPCRWPAAISIVPTAAVAGRFSGRHGVGRAAGEQRPGRVGRGTGGRARSRAARRAGRTAPISSGRRGTVQDRAHQVGREVVVPRRERAEHAGASARRPRRARQRSRPGRGAAPPRSRRRTGARGRPRASARPGRGRRAAARRGTATPRRAGAPRSRRRAARPGRSARRCGCRRRSRRAPRAP